ncbi:AAA family ATPase [Streptomyces sp. NPDC001027]|uniref:AAA family ATPase n=1 Tax=Streptomyces sp. NPDC001027 TaxID=3154771 RepID=UPI003319FB67
MAGLIREVADTLTTMGYVSATLSDVPVRRFGGEVTDFLDRQHPDDLCIVYAAGHGVHWNDRRAPGADGGTDQRWSDASFWSDLLHSGHPSRPTVLFVFDTSPAAPRRFELGPDGLPPRNWLILDSGSREGPRSAGALSRALVSVLSRLRHGALDIDSRLAVVPLQTLAQEIQRELSYSVASALVMAGPSDARDLEDGEGSPPFFMNPAYMGGRRHGLLPRSIDPAVLPFLADVDAGLDHLHFMERASGTSAVAEYGRGVLGRFTGRRRELDTLSDWLDDPNARGPALVTGAPGSGKSALLGILVCAAHPALREVTEELWMRAFRAPLPAVKDFAAVHARQRDVSEVCDSIARQLGVGARSPDRLLQLLRKKAAPPVVIVDALDEMIQGSEVMHRLLLPLALDRRDDGRPLARVLVATRPYAEFQPLLDAAAESGLLVDLDRVPRQELAEDLADYVTGILRTTSQFRRRSSVVHAFAHELASALVDQRSPELPWGSFLVAGLLTRHFINSGAERVSVWQEAAEAAHRVPHTLTEFLELELRSQPDLFWLRPVLTALGTAHGQGMPVSALSRVAPLFAAEGDDSAVPAAPSPDAMKETLEAARFYLRSVTDVDGTLLYRLFHQSMADYLVADFAQSAGDRDWRRSLLKRLLAPLGHASARKWDAAEPYILRHGIAIAKDADREWELLEDPEFLFRADPRAVREALAGHFEPQGLPRPVLERLLDRKLSARHRRTAASLTALRDGHSNLAHRLSEPVHGAALPWQPRWTTSCPTRPERLLALSADHRTELFVLSAGEGDHVVLEGHTGQRTGPEHPHPARLVDAQRFSLAGRAVALATDATGHLWIHEPGTPHLIDAGRGFGSLAPFATSQEPAGPSVHALFNGLLVVCRGTAEGSVIVESAVDRDLLVRQERVHKGPVTALTVRYGKSGLRLLTGGADATVKSWNPEGDLVERILILDSPVRALDITSDDELFVASDNEVAAFLGRSGDR